MMRSILASRLVLGLLITALCASTNAATAHRFKPRHAQLHAGQHVPRSYYSEDHDPVQNAAGPRQFAVPGWTEQETSKWLHDASAGSGKY